MINLEDLNLGHGLEGIYRKQRKMIVESYNTTAMKARFKPGITI